MTLETRCMDAPVDNNRSPSRLRGDLGGGDVIPQGVKRPPEKGGFGVEAGSPRAETGRGGTQQDAPEGLFQGLRQGGFPWTSIGGGNLLNYTARKPSTYLSSKPIK